MVITHVTILTAMSLSTRQSELLRIIIEEYIENAEPVASMQIVKSRHFQVCGATIRNTMSDLVKKGYLQMVHVSSGRMPTELAYRYYITELMEETDVNVLDEVALKQRIWQKRYDLERLLKDTGKALSDTTGNMSFGITEDGFISYSGASKLLESPEFYEIDAIRSVLRFVDDFELAYSILNKTVSKEGITVLIGREIGLANMDNVSIIASFVNFNSKFGYIGVIGPSRMYYQKVIPIVRRAVSLLEQAVESS